MAKMLLRQWAEARLRPGDVEFSERGLILRKGPLYDALERLCYSRKLSGKLGAELVDPIVTPPGGFDDAGVIIHRSALFYRRDWYEEVHVDDDELPSDSEPARRGRGRPSAFDRINKAHTTLEARGLITYETPWPTKGELIRGELGVPEGAKNFDNETIRINVIAHRVFEAHDALEAEGVIIDEMLLPTRVELICRRLGVPTIQTNIKERLKNRLKNTSKNIF